jgi:hypothetical protein
VQQPPAASKGRGKPEVFEHFVKRSEHETLKPQFNPDFPLGNHFDDYLGEFPMEAIRITY